MTGRNSWGSRGASRRQTPSSTCSRTTCSPTTTFPALWSSRRRHGEGDSESSNELQAKKSGPHPETAQGSLQQGPSGRSAIESPSPAFAPRACEVRSEGCAAFTQSRGVARQGLKHNQNRRGRQRVREAGHRNLAYENDQTRCQIQTGCALASQIGLGILRAEIHWKVRSEA